MEYMDEALKATKYVIYVRKSTDDPGKQLRSTEDQITECMALARRLKLNVVDKPIVEEISAKKPDKRPGFNDMLKQINKGLINGIIAWHPDRLARNMLEGGKIVQLLDDGKLIDLRFVSANFENDANGKLMLGLQFVLSKHYSDKLATDIKRGIINNLRAGKSTGSYKPGYYRDPATGFYHKDGKNFDLIKRVWDLKLDGTKEAEIVERINELGYKRQLKSKNPRQRKTQFLTKNKLNRLLADPIYYGVLIQKGEEIDLFGLYDFEAMITKEEFLSVQKSRRGYLKESTKHDFPFRGFVICSKCGKHRISSPSKGKSTRYLYLRCDSENCPERGKSIRTKELIDTIHKVLSEGFSLANINANRLRTTINNSMKKANQEITNEKYLLEGQLRAKKLDLERITNNYIEFGGTYGKLELKAYEERKESLETEIKFLLRRITNLKKAQKTSIDSVGKTLNTLQRASESFLHGDYPKKDKIARIMFLNTHVEGKKVLYLTAKEPFNQLLNHPLVSNGGANGT